MADAIEQLLASVELRRRMGTAAREFALREFEPSRLVQQVVNLYYRLCGQSQACSRASSLRDVAAPLSKANSSADVSAAVTR